MATVISEGEEKNVEGRKFQVFIRKKKMMKYNDKPLVKKAKPVIGDFYFCSKKNKVNDKAE